MKQNQKNKIIKEIDQLINAIKKRLHGSPLLSQTKKPAPMKQPKGIIGGKLKDYQLQSLSWMVQLANNKLSGILADDMGLGKTVQSISYLTYIQQSKKINGKHLIIVPKNVLNNWMKEFTFWNPTFRVVLLPGTELQREHVLKTKIRTSQFDVLVATYYSVQICQTNLKKFLWETVIVDEAHSIKNSETCIAQSLRMLKFNFALLLTGTPLSNELTELWSLLNFIVPDIFSDPTLFSRIENSVETECSSQEEKMRYQAEIAGRFKAIISPFMLRRVKSQINLGLKGKKEFSLFVSLSELQLTMYRNYLKMKSVYGDEKRTQCGAIQMRKLCGHPYLFSDVEDPNAPPYGEHLVEASGKLKLLDKLLVKLFKQKHKVLIFSQFVIMLKILEDYCTYRNYKYELISGESSLTQRDEAIDRFSNREDTKIFLISTRAGGIGLNLVAADVVIMYDLDWNPQIDKQAMDRAYRIGQKRNVKIFKLITNNTVEQRILEVQKYKLIWDELVIQKGGLAKMKSSEQKFENLDKDHFASLGAGEIFKFQQNYDDKTIDQIIKMGEEKDYNVTQEIRKKLQKQFQLAGESVDPYKFFEDKDDGEVGRDYKAKGVGQSKQSKRIKTVSSTRGNYLEPEAHHLFENTNMAGGLLWKVSNSKDEQKQNYEQKLRNIGFYDWSLSQYKEFVEANCSFMKDNYEQIAKKIKNKSMEEVKSYSQKYFEVGEGSDVLLKDIRKIMKKQKELKIEQEKDQMQAAILKSDWNLFYLKNKSFSLTMNVDSYYRLYFNELKFQKKFLPQHEEMLMRICPLEWKKIKAKKFVGQNKNENYKKVLQKIEVGAEKNTKILNDRFELLYKSYCPNLQKVKTKTKVALKDSQDSKGESSVETMDKSKLKG